MQTEELGEQLINKEEEYISQDLKLALLLQKEEEEQFKELNIIDQDSKLAAQLQAEFEKENKTQMGHKKQFQNDIEIPDLEGKEGANTMEQEDILNICLQCINPNQKCKFVSQNCIHKFCGSCLFDHLKEYSYLRQKVIVCPMCLALKKQEFGQSLTMDQQWEIQIDRIVIKEVLGQKHLKNLIYHIDPSYIDLIQTDECKNESDENEMETEQNQNNNNVENAAQCFDCNKKSSDLQQISEKCKHLYCLNCMDQHIQSVYSNCENKIYCKGCKIYNGNKNLIEDQMIIQIIGNEKFQKYMKRYTESLDYKNLESLFGENLNFQDSNNTTTNNNNNNNQKQMVKPLQKIQEQLDQMQFKEEQDRKNNMTKEEIGQNQLFKNIKNSIEKPKIKIQYDGKLLFKKENSNNNIWLNKEGEEVKTNEEAEQENEQNNESDFVKKQHLDINILGLEKSNIQLTREMTALKNAQVHRNNIIKQRRKSYVDQNQNNIEPSQNINQQTNNQL